MFQRSIIIPPRVTHSVPPRAAQSGLLFLEKTYPKTTYNHLSIAFEIAGQLNLDLFNQALWSVIERHEMLRARIPVKARSSVFNITPIDNMPNTPTWPLHYQSCMQHHTTTSSSTDSASSVIIPTPDTIADTLIWLQNHSAFFSPFDLANGPLWRATLIQVDTHKAHLVMLFNAVIMDKQSIHVFCQNLSECYNALLENRAAELTPLPSLSELDFNLPADEIEKRLSYWTQHLADLNVVNLELDAPPKSSTQFTGRRDYFHLEADTVAQLNSLTENSGYTHHQIILAALYSVLFRYSGETDICVGMASANRKHPQIDNTISSQLVSCLFNIIPLRLIFSKETKFSELLEQVKLNVKTGVENQLPLDKIYGEAISRDTKAALKWHALFNIMLVLNSAESMLTLNNLTTASPVEPDLGQCKFPYFSISLNKTHDTYQGFIEYNTELFTANTIQRFMGHFVKTIQYFAQHPDSHIAHAPLLLEEEKLLLDQLNNTTREPVTPLLVPDFFHQQASHHSDETFVAFYTEAGELMKTSYGDIDKQSSQLAYHLRNSGVTRGVNVGICLTRSSYLIVAMLAVLKSGGTMVTMETEACPALSHKMESAQPLAIIVDNQTGSLFAEIDTVTRINVESSETLALLQQQPDTHPVFDISPLDPAYIMYTSGTSGSQPKPKGVILSHGGFTNLLNALFAQNIPAKSKVLCTALPTFDAFLYDVLCALISQGELYLCFDTGRWSPSILSHMIRTYHINFFVTVPNLLNVLDPTLPLNDVTSMGAAPHEETMRTWALAQQDRIMRNGLGHTETGICLSLHPYQPGTNHTLIGGPIANMQMFILNPEHYSVCPVGVPGELYVAGPGLALGYDNPELTKEKFRVMSYDPVTHTFTPCTQDEASANHVRLYATGDYACYWPHHDGISIKFIGRKDRQLKIKGVRVDLDLVESVLRHLVCIKDIMMVPNSDQTGLYAYIIPQPHVGAADISQAIKNFLPTTTLPRVAYPRSINLLPEFPLTPNGKVNMRALPAPAAPEHEAITSPSTALQIELRKVWANILKIPEETSISITHEFEYLGGDSYSLAQVEVALNLKYPQLSSKPGVSLCCFTKEMTIESLAKNMAPLIGHSGENKARLRGTAYLQPPPSSLFHRKSHSDADIPSSSKLANVSDPAASSISKRNP